MPSSVIDMFHAEDAAQLWHRGIHDLSLADRASLATAAGRGMTAVTADRRWADVDGGPAVEVIR
jgi:PIN domain nuclease of toxin-antitoxin system